MDKIHRSQDVAILFLKSCVRVYESVFLCKNNGLSFTFFSNTCVCAFQDVCGAADTREQPVDAGGAGRL